MPDEPTVDAPQDGPAPRLVRIAVDRYLSAWENARDARSRPSADEVLAALPERDRPALRPFVNAFAALVHTTADRPPATPDTLDGRPERTVALTVGRTAAEHSNSVTGDFSPSVQATGGQAQPLQPVPGYEILGELGRGGMGVVYKARQIRLRRIVALKLMLRADYAGETARERFDAEAQAVARMQHPNIVQVFEVGEVDRKPYFSLEFVDGGTLSDKVAKNLMRPKDASTLMVTLARAMHYAHEHGIVHRDLKPGNILLTEDGIPKIADFGLAKKLEEDSGLTRMGTIVGTPSFMPPEQAAGEVDRVGKSADIYSLGAILYDLLTGRPPFKGANVLETLELVRSQEPLAPSGLQPGVPRDLETICLKCLQKDPARRYATAAELADDLDRFIRGEPILARPISNLERAWRWCRRNHRVASLLGAVGALLILIAAGSIIAAVIINNSRSQIEEQKDTISNQLVEITAKERLAEDRLEAYRQGVDTFVNEAPSILEGHPLGHGPSERLLEMTIKLLEDAQGKADDAGLAERGQLSILLQQSELARATGDRPKAEKLLDTAQLLARRLATPGQPERDKGAGNLALVLNQQAADARAAGNFPKAIALHNTALAEQQRVLEAPESGEISPDEARWWMVDTHYRLAVTRHNYAKTLRLPEAARSELTQARGDLAESLKILRSLTPPLQSRLSERVKNLGGLAALEDGRVCERLGDHDAADKSYDESIEWYKALVDEAPNNLKYRLNLSVAAAEYGDLLLIKRKDAVKAREMYSQSVEQVRRIAQPPELELLLNTLAINYYREATAARTAMDEPNAKRLYGLCLEIREMQYRAAERLSESIKKADPRPLQSAKINLMLAQARFGKYKEAETIANELVEQWPKVATWQASAAQGYALCAAAVPEDESKQREALLDSAFKALNRAIEHGYRNIAALESDPDFEPLRSDRGSRYADAIKLMQAPPPVKKSEKRP